MKLTEQQEKAAYAVGSVVVTAGAGTGKTAMLAERFFHHVNTDGLRPIEIVAVTFTEKAAAELRQRIRKTLAERDGREEIIAEVDAAQISTIHALAARICREFYHLANISADFRVLLETESAIWLADKFDAAMGEVDEAIISELGYSWLKDVIGQLLLDPDSAAKAFEHDAESWKKIIDQERERSIDWLKNSEAWAEAEALCKEFSGREGDNLERARCDAINAMADIDDRENIRAAIATIRKLPAHQGQQGNWPAGGLAQIRAALKALKKAADATGPVGAADLFFGPEDARAAEKGKLLKKAFASVHSYLQEHKKHDKVLDFIDLELFAREILAREDGQARKYYAKRWRAYLVDEFQDTNPIQAEILELLKGDAKQTIVGDEKQSIYGFRRADIEVFRKVRQTVAESGGHSIELSETFRSHESLAVMMNETFAPVLGDLHQRLNANRKDSPNREIPLTLTMIPRDVKASPEAIRVAESRHIADEIKRMIDSRMSVFDKRTGQLRHVEYRDVAILSRTWAAIDVYIDALSAAGIPAVNAGGGSLLDTREAKDAAAMLGFLSDTTDDISLAAVVRSPFFAISDRALYELVGSKQKDQTWWQLLQKAEGPIGRARDTLAELMKIKNKVLPEELLREADKMTGYTAAIANLPQGDRREADWLGMLSLLRQLSLNGRSDLFGAVRQIKALSQGRNSIPRLPLDAGNAVTLTTIHNAKGLEWPVVIIPDLSSQVGGWSDKLLIESCVGIAFEVEDDSSAKTKPAIYELIKKIIDARKREEEKRLLYVAVTRARDRVILTSGPEKKGTAIEMLMPGITAANIPIADMPYSDELAIPPTPLDPPPFSVPEFRHPDAIKTGLSIIPVTGLTEYAICPLKFRYMYVEGHPGLGEGDAKRKTVGTLTHKGLQFDINLPEDLDRIAEGAPAEFVREALALAKTFRENPAFADFQSGQLEREKAFSFELKNGVTLRGAADLVGEDFVLDYKTGDEQDTNVYRFQLWAYAAALKKPKAFVAFLRDARLYEFPAAEMKAVEKAAASLTGNIAAGNFPATPSRKTCSKCIYSNICPNSATKVPQSKAATDRGQQLELF